MMYLSRNYTDKRLGRYETRNWHWLALGPLAVLWGSKIPERRWYQWWRE
jgi:hypothetical protein